MTDFVTAEGSACSGMFSERKYYLAVEVPASKISRNAGKAIGKMQRLLGNGMPEAI
jgi:hypothetical protein